MKRKRINPMYTIAKYRDCWAVHNDSTGESRPLNEEECRKLSEEFPALADQRTKNVYTDRIRSIDQLP